MFFVAIDSVQPGDVVARAIYDGRDIPLVAEGSALSAYEIGRLKALGFQGIYVRGSRVSSKLDGQALSTAVRSAAVAQLTQAFRTLQDGGVLPVEALKQSVDDMLGDVLGAGTVITSLTSLRTHDNYTFEHSVNVAALALVIGGEVGLDEEQLAVLGLGALLHDVGKTSLSPTILRKPNKLTPTEYRNMQEHPRLGYDIVRAYKELDAAVAHIAYQHHERVDGRGYPRRLPGAKIHPLAKIVTVADVFDALTADRVYRKGMPTARVLDILKQEAGTAFDVHIVEHFVGRVAPYPVGTVVRLSSGVLGTVTSVPQDNPTRPTVRVLRDVRSRALADPDYLDLRYDATVHIVDVVTD